jgi:xylulokinase
VLWIKNHEPEVYKKARWFLTSEAYLVYKLTGKASIDIYTAGGYAPLYDVHRKTWLKGPVTDLITPLERLPQAYWSHEVVGKVTAEAARETGLAEGTPVVAGTTDAPAEAVSAGISEIGDMMLMFGSSIFFIMMTEKLVKTQRFWSSNFLEEGTYAFLGGMSTSGSLTTWFRDQFSQHEIEQEKVNGENAYAVLTRLAANSVPGSNGLIALPYFEGERTPLHDPKARGMWFGLNLQHTKGDLYRSLLEGVAFGIRNNFEVMNGEGVQPKRILAVGGGTKNPLWLQIVADVCNLALMVPEQQIGASYGDAFLAAMGIGLYKNLSEVNQWVRIKDVVNPDETNRAAYDFNYQIFRELYPANKALMHRLADHRMA